MKIKILIPVYNDFQSVSKLISDINSTILNLKGEFSLILVNDASTDKTDIDISNVNSVLDGKIDKFLESQLIKLI